MTTVSAITRKLVKPKPTDFPALPDSADPQLKNQLTDQAGRPDQAQGLQKTGPAAAEHFKWTRDIAVVHDGATSEHTSVTARFILGFIAACVHYGRWGPLAMETMARTARCSLWRVIRARQALVAAGCLCAERRGKCYWYFVPEWVEGLPKTWVNPALVRDDRYSIVRAFWLSLMKFWQGENDASWHTHGEAAEILGVSYPTIYRTAAWAAVQGLVQKRHRPERRELKNKYRLTNLGREETGVFELKTARSKRRALGETIMAKSYSYANKVRKGSLRAKVGLSFDPNVDGDLYKLVVGSGAHRSVAESIAVQWRHDPESVRQAIINSAHRVEASAEQLRRYNLPRWRGTHTSYLIGTLNRARREGHSVPASRLARDAEAADESSARAAVRGPPSEPEFEQRKKEQLRRLFIPPAKPITTYTDAELALITRQRDKEAGDASLTRTLAAVRRNCRIYTEVADLG